MLAVDSAMRSSTANTLSLVSMSTTATETHAPSNATASSAR